jgi:hypothetical protein
MIRDEELRSLIATSIDPAELHDFDPAAIARVASRRTRRRRMILGCVGALGLVAAGVVAESAYSSQKSDAPSVAEPSSTAREAAGARPGCSWAFNVKLTSAAVGSRDGAPTVATTQVGTAARAEVELTSADPVTRIVRGYLVVARPGTINGAGDPARMPVDSVARPENQLVAGDPVLDVVPGGQRVSVTFRPGQPGAYPVFFVTQLAQPRDCGATAALPAGTSPNAGSSQEVGEIIVS